MRAYASIADSLAEAGFSAAEGKALARELDGAVELREIIRRASGETLDLKAYEADMRHLIDAYIKADEARKISAFGEMGLVDLIVKSGIGAAIASLPERIRGNRDAVAEVITNNVRSRIMREHLHDPAFYDRMSTLLAEVLADLKARRIDYEEFLKRMAAVAAQVCAGEAEDTPEPLKQSPGLRALYNTLAAAPASSGRVAEPKADYGTTEVDPVLELAQQIHARLLGSAPDGWRGVLPKEQEIKRLIYEVVQDTTLVEIVFPVVKARSEY
jgi:type I restriction enzyme R subunit